jgi:hypothetical protein
MRITDDPDEKKFTREIEIPDADDIELGSSQPDKTVIRSVDETPFAKGYSPESLPKLEIPDLPLDAVSVSVDDLPEIDDTDEEDPLSIPVLAWSPPEAPIDQEMLSAIQENKSQADQRAEIIKARMGMLTSQISSLNDKLARLENSSKIKV